MALVLKRWTGAAWEDVGTELTIDYPCLSDQSVDFAIDSTNAPVVIYNSTSFIQNVQSSYTTVRRFSGGAWQGVGPNDGVLPHTDANTTACRTAPVIRIGPDDRAVVAYQSLSTQYVQRFDGTNWVDVVAGSSFPASTATGTIELQFDAMDRLWMVLTSPTYPYGRVTRLNPSPTPAWEAVGPNNGVLPTPANVVEVYAPRLRFDASNNPVIGATASVGSTSYSAGLIVYRYNGPVWSSTGGYQSTGPNSRSAGPRLHDFALLNGDAITAWINNFTGAPVDAVLLVQRNTPSGWTSIGASDGRVLQFTEDLITQRRALQPRLVTIGADLYMAVNVQSTVTNTTIPRRVYLLRKMAN
jgi:hypothetical protein